MHKITQTNIRKWLFVCHNKRQGNHYYQKGIMIHAERIIVETDTAGNIKQLPKLPANSRIEAIFFGDG